MVTSHEPNRYGPRKLNTAMRFAKNGSPSPTVVSGGHVPGSDAPFVERRVVISTGYPAMLDAQLPSKPPALNGLRLGSLFCGCGGIDLGFRSAGFELAFASDYWDKAAAAFGLNLGHSPMVADVRDVKASDVGKVDVLTGGFPCVTFSTAGARKGVVDDVAGKLYLELVRLIADVRPRYFVAENVQGILSANGGNAVKLVLAAFMRAGYRVQHELVNMAEHGVPQTRMRVVFVGVRADQWRGAFAFPRRTHRLREDKRGVPWLPLARSLREAIGDLGQPEQQVRAQTHAGGATLVALGRPSTEGYGYSRLCAPDEPAHSQAGNPNSLHVRIRGSRNDDFHNSLRHGDGPSVAVVSSQAPEVHGAGEVRRMTVRECARVQSFPDWYRFGEVASDGYRMVGNAVPPLYALRLACAIADYDSRSK